MAVPIFWRLHHPKYPTDAAARLMNGELSYPYALPGVRCDTCGQTWGGSRTLLQTLPESLRERVELRQPWPIDAESHGALRAEVLEALRASGSAPETLKPGDRFQPAWLDVPIHADADFLWTGGSVLVSDRVKGALGRIAARGVAFAPVTSRLGRRAPAAVRRSSAARSGGDLDPVSYHQLIVTAESANPPGVDHITVCAACGRTAFDHDKRRLVMMPEMWRGDDVFLLATTLWIIVTEPVRRVIDELEPANVEFKSLDA